MQASFHLDAFVFEKVYKCTIICLIAYIQGRIKECTRKITWPRTRFNIYRFLFSNCNGWISFWEADNPLLASLASRPTNSRISHFYFPFGQEFFFFSYGSSISYNNFFLALFFYVNIFQMRKAYYDGYNYKRRKCWIERAPQRCLESFIFNSNPLPKSKIQQIKTFCLHGSSKHLSIVTKGNLLTLMDNRFRVRFRNPSFSLEVFV